MTRSNRNKLKLALFVLIVFCGALASSRQVLAAAKLAGKWRITITFPDAPGSSTMRDLVVNLDASPLGDSLVGRLTITDQQNRTVGGVWRQVGKQVSIAYELPCSDGEGACATLILTGKVKGDILKKGPVIVMWDTTSDRDPSLFDTSNGTFSGIRLE